MDGTRRVLVGPAVFLELEGIMVGIDTIVYVIVGLLIGGLILGLLWWLIVYCEKEFPGYPLVFKFIRIVFVVLVVLLLISVLLHLIGFPVVRFGR